MACHTAWLYLTCIMSRVCIKFRAWRNEPVVSESVSPCLGGEEGSRASGLLAVHCVPFLSLGGSYNMDVLFTS